MKLYHASKEKFTRLERRQAHKAEGYDVTEAELQNRIYLTPDLSLIV